MPILVPGVAAEAPGAVGHAGSPPPSWSLSAEQRRSPWAGPRPTFFGRVSRSAAGGEVVVLDTHIDATRPRILYVGRLRRLLLAVDDSDSSGRAVPIACEIARSVGCEVIVLHVRDREICCTGPAWERPMTCTPEELVARLVTDLRGAGVNAIGEVHASLNHREAEEILASAEAVNADLVVAGAGKHRLTLGGILEKSTGRKIVERSRRPVLLVP
jgi:nucleotide-binding universal stress UspA family protein